jgi:DNA helicase HerA-like ATPase
MQGISIIKYPAIYLNIEEEKMPGKFIRVNSEDSEMSQIIDALKHGAKFDLRMPINLTRSSAITGYVIDRLMQAGFDEKRPVYLIIDECHLLEGFGLKKAIEAATRGRKRGIRCIFITQRPALANKTLYTQAKEQYIFYLPASEKEYLKNKGLNYEKCLDMWTTLGDYSYIYYDGFKYEGRRAI